MCVYVCTWPDTYRLLHLREVYAEWQGVVPHKSASVCNLRVVCCVIARLCTQTRFRDVFNSYDTGRRGALGPRELGRLVRDVTPEATDAQIKYFAVSQEGACAQTDRDIHFHSQSLLLHMHGTHSPRFHMPILP